MKKNWLPIALLLAFIFLYDRFVIRPGVEQARIAQEQKAAEQAKAVTPNSAAPTNTSTSNTSVSAKATTVAIASSANTLSEDEKKEFQTVNIGNKRDLKIYSNGAIGSATFADYNVREIKTPTPVTLMESGLKWSSSDPAVEKCLLGLRRSSNGYSFEGAVSDSVKGNCSVVYNIEASKPGLISAKLTLKGFAGAQGFVELRGSDLLGPGSAQDHSHLLYTLNDSKKELREKKLFETAEPIVGKVGFLSWGDRYFATILMPKGNFNPNIVHGAAVAGAMDPAKDKVYYGFQYPLTNQGAEVSYDLDILFSTRDASYLTTIRPDLEKAVELGMFPLIARALIFALNLINKAVGNYGIAIVILTMVARLAFWPLNKKVFQSGQKMKALQPEMDRIKKKYGNDKSKAQEMNLEVMGLYKKHGVNPMGSCLPMLLQLPIWFGLYQALNHSLDLYQAPFYLWIKDLSAPDQFYVFPILWTVSLVAYVFVNPTPQQPGQPDMRWMMMVMNCFFGFMSAKWPAGLTLYLFVSNLVGISQQLMMQRGSKKLLSIQEGA